MPRVSSRLPNHGFTLIEMIASIAIAGVVIALVGLFGRQQIDAFVDVSNRAELADVADVALRRVARDLRSALPGSVRPTAGAATLIEFVPVREAGRYRQGAVPDVSSPVDVLGRLDVTGAGLNLVIHNPESAAMPGAIYDGTQRRTATISASPHSISWGGGDVPGGSPSLRFHTVETPVTYHCDLAAGQLVRRWGYGFRAVQPTAGDFGALAHTSALVADGVTGCSFTINGADGIVTLSLAVVRNGETVVLTYDVAVDNTP